MPPRHSECSQSLRCTTLQRNCFERLIGAGRGAQTNKLGIGRAATRPSVRPRPILPYECMQHAMQHRAAATERHRSNRRPRHATRAAPHCTVRLSGQRALRAAPNGAFRPCGAARMRVSTHPMARVVLLCLRRTIGCAAYESRDLFAHGTCAARCMRRATSACKMHE